MGMEHIGGLDEATLRDLEPGEHESSVYMSNGSHEELEEGATIEVMVMEKDQ